MSGMGSSEESSAVGWNCTNSGSASRAPALIAIAIPSPVTSAGLVVLAYTRPIPPVATTTDGASNVPADPSSARV